MTSPVTQRRVARALRPGGPDVIEVGVEDLAPLQSGEVLVRIEAAGLNHAETLIRSGNYAVRLPFPHAVGGEGAGTVVATDVACLAVAGLTAGGLARVWPIEGGAAVVWSAAGAVGRMLVASLADRGVDVIGIASGRRVDAVRAAGAAHVIDRTTEDVRDAVRAYTDGHGVAAVFDPIGAATFETSLQLLAPRGCLINYGELSGPVPAINLHQLFPGSVFMTKYNGMRWVEGLHEFAGLISDALTLATKRRAVISDIAGRFPLDHVADAYRALESDPRGKVLVLPNA